MKRGTIILILIFSIGQFGFSQSHKVEKKEKAKVEEKVQKKEKVKVEKKIKKGDKKAPELKVIKSDPVKVKVLSNVGTKIGHSNKNQSTEIKEQKIKEQKIRNEKIKGESIKGSTIDGTKPDTENSLSRLGKPIQPTKIKASASTLNKGTSPKTNLKEKIYKKSQKHSKKKIEE